MSDDKGRKIYRDSGIIYRNTKAVPGDLKASAYTGRIQTTCCHCNRATDFWLNADVKDGKKGKFFAIRAKRMKEQSDAIVEQYVPRGTNSPSRPQATSRPQAPTRPAPQPQPQPEQPASDDAEFQY